MAIDKQDLKTSVESLRRFVQFIDTSLKQGQDGISLTQHDADLLLDRLGVLLGYVEDAEEELHD